MILGASYSQLPLYEAARKLGAATVAASTPGDWPGFAVADESVYADITNPEAILKAAQEKGIDGIATCCLDAGVRALGYTCEKMGLIGPSARAADISNDKFKMKEAFMAGGVQCARHICIHSLEEALEKLEFPVVLKAVDLWEAEESFAAIPGRRLFSIIIRLWKQHERTTVWSKNLSRVRCSDVKL